MTNMKPGPKPDPATRRRPRGTKWSDAEWAHVVAQAKAAGMPTAVWLRAVAARAKR